MKKADPKLLDYLPDQDMMIVQRRFLLDVYEKRREVARQRHRAAGAISNLDGEQPASLPPSVPPLAQAWPPKTQAAQARSSAVSEPTEAKATGPQHELPPMLYSFESVYRYTRGINDISNPGMGYGEVTRETRWSRKGDTLSRVELAMRRTRTGRQEVDREPKPPTDKR